MFDSKRLLLSLSSAKNKIINTKIPERIMSTRVITTTVQYNEEAIKMLEMTLKSFYLFNSNFDFKVYCLDNSKELFENYFSKIAVENNFQNLEFINFKDGTKWNSFVERVKNNKLTDLEKKNMFENKAGLYVFDTTFVFLN